jgi:hypothetical protein
LSGCGTERERFEFLQHQQPWSLRS